MEEKIMPVYFTDNSTGEKYELDFSREGVKWAEQRGFNIHEIDTKSASCVDDLFYYSFRKNHRSLSREKVDKLREKSHGIPESKLTQLVQLFVQAQTSNTVLTDEEAAKNGEVTWE